ncbi:hypothetical protein DICVIV_07058 [Dictyocaulus viviparus]|uniref:Uncharacterized protein n=1 Tax=Dictyocaulus viviparus TaxID=29172 RepID=A0A0D8XSY8_DICVI|nr:hypothetical protein DICVIV_07058 [Dictyocaulus viviparus]
MGTTASTHKTTVKRISIDQNGWSRPCSRATSSSSRRSLPILSNFIQNKSSHENNQRKTERLHLVDRAIRAESKAQECEGKMKGLEREIRKLELRNHDLSTEVSWLRQQCTIVNSDNADLSGLRMELERMKNLEVRKDIRISELTKELDSAKIRINALEDLCRNQIDVGLPPSTSSFDENEEQIIREEKSNTEDKHHQQEHPENTASEQSVINATNILKNSNIRTIGSHPRPSLRNIFTMRKDHRIDGKGQNAYQSIRINSYSSRNADLRGLRMELERIKKLEVREDIRISELTKELDSAKIRINALEDLCRNQIDVGLPPSTSSFNENEEQIIREEKSNTEDKHHQQEHPENTASEQSVINATNILKNSNIRTIGSHPRPSLRNIFTMRKDHRIDGKVCPSTTMDSLSNNSLRPALRRGETFPVLKSMQVLNDIPQRVKVNESVERPQDDPYSNEKKLIEDSETDESDINIDDILNTSNKSTISVGLTNQN